MAGCRKVCALSGKQEVQTGKDEQNHRDQSRDRPEPVELSVGYPEFKQGQILQALPCVFVHADQEVTARR